MASSGSYAAYRIVALINNEDTGIDNVFENFEHELNYPYSRAFQIDQKLEADDTITFIDAYAYDTVEEYSENLCKTAGEEHSCSYITGKLRKKL